MIHEKHAVEIQHGSNTSNKIPAYSGGPYKQLSAQGRKVQRGRCKVTRHTTQDPIE